MPTYTYEVEKYEDVFEVNHEISFTISTLEELIKYMEDNQDKVNIIEQKSELEYLLEDTQEKLSIYKIMTPSNFLLKGGGWSSTNLNSRYTGKNRKLYEKLRDERSRRRSKNLSVADVSNELGIKSGGCSSVVDNKSFEKLSKEKKKIANEYGLRSSEDYTK